MMMASETFEVYQVNDVRCGKLDGKIRALQDTMPLHVDDLPDVRNGLIAGALRARRYTIALTIRAPASLSSVTSCDCALCQPE
jgi:hypothetical protein